MATSPRSPSRQRVSSVTTSPDSDPLERPAEGLGGLYPPQVTNNKKG